MENTNFGKKGFTIIEIAVVIVITLILTAIISAGLSQYIGRGKDANIAANLVVLIPAGESYYTNNGNSYAGFCDPATNSVLKNAITQMPANPNSGYFCYDATTNPAGVCCAIGPYSASWAACARKFGDTSKAFCVDSRGIKKDIDQDDCAYITDNCDIP